MPTVKVAIYSAASPAVVVVESGGSTSVAEDGNNPPASAEDTIKVRLSASHVHSDFARSDTDIDIRYGLQTWSDLHTEAIFTRKSFR